MRKSRRQKRFEKKIKRSKRLRDQFGKEKPMIQERIDYLRQKLVEIAAERKT